MAISSKCVNCGAVMNDEAKYCTKCGTQLPVMVENYCTNPDCIRHRKGHIFVESDAYCDLCGKPTIIGEQVLKNI